MIWGFAAGNHLLYLFIFLVFLLPSFFFLHGFVSHIKNVVLPSIIGKTSMLPLKDRLEGFF